MSLHTHQPRDTRPLLTDGQRVERRQAFFGFTFSARTAMGTLADLYGLSLRAPERYCTVAEFLSHNAGGQLRAGDRVRIGRIELVVQEATADGAPAKVGIALNRLAARAHDTKAAAVSPLWRRRP
jgi:NhaP-type Na+/H+ and K+/H+ antiporter